MKRVNLEKLIQIIILSLTIYFIFVGLISRNINKYVNPKFNILLWISLIIFILFIISFLLDQRSSRHNINLSSSVIYLLPILAAILFQPGTSGREATDILYPNINQSEVNSSNEENGLEVNLDELNNLNAGNSNPSNQIEQNTQEVSNVSEKYNGKQEEGYYIIDDNIFSEWFMDVNYNMNEFVGKKYEYIAQVFTMEDLNENQFLAGRYFMTCCAADLTGYGIICESDSVEELKKEEFIRVKGTISKVKYNGIEVPVLVDTYIEKVKAPAQEYIYTNN